MVFRIMFFGILAFFFYWGTSHAAGGRPVDVGAGTPREVTGGEYRARYVLANASQKLVQNNGTGFADLYGTRNFRAVLNGVYYRGGANNVYHVPKRDNSNPLPDDGLNNLCGEGFGHAVYFYSTNYSTAPHVVKCKDNRGNDNTLEYLQISPLAFRAADLEKLLTMIHEHVRNPRLGPIYGHCWNGWHASGYVAASALQQFCGFTAEQAVAYWNLNTDGNNGASYDRIRDQIRKFRPFPALSLTAAEKTAMCPDPASLQFGGKSQR